MDEALSILEEEFESEEKEILDLVLLPPTGGDGTVSDEEEGDEENLTSTNIPKEVSGPLEIHTNIEIPLSHAPSLTEEDVDKFIGILMLSGYHRLPRQHMYWSEQEDLEVPIVANTMLRNRFVAIKKYFHFADNKTLTPGDKIAKIRPLYDHVNRVLERFGPYEKHLCIDEQMVPYHGHHSCTMFIRGKPVRFGFKNWVLATASGYPVRIEMYNGKDEVEQSEPIGLGPNVVLKLLRSVSNPAFHTVFFDNFFTSYDLMALLSEKGFRSTGTAKDNRLLKCPLPDSKTIDQAKRGTHWSRSDGKVLVVKWKDIKTVTVVTNFDKVEPLQQCARRSKTEKKRVFVEQPSLIKVYNSFIGGVDLLDQAISDYRPTIVWKKWYGPLIINCFSVLRVAAWKIHKILGGKLDQLNFCRAVVFQLLKNPRRAVARPGPRVQITKALRESHYLVICGIEDRCVICRRNSRKKCRICDVKLHYQCFWRFHT
ncbi:PiggyBac transposable element-derived protein 3 [Armadillidium vulgare]|nr:PiggyBac transposable element-derived protein 3 [Armadillidium vulgare]